MHVLCSKKTYTRLILCITEKHASLDKGNQIKIQLISSSSNYFHLPLNALPKAYGLEAIAKSWFPHCFNLPKHHNFIGPITAACNVLPGIMKSKEGAQFSHRRG